MFRALVILGIGLLPGGFCCGAGSGVDWGLVKGSYGRGRFRGRRLGGISGLSLANRSSFRLVGFRCGVRRGFRRCATFNRFRVRRRFFAVRRFVGGFRSSFRAIGGRCGSSFATAFVEAVHSLINLVDHLFADAGNFHKLLGGHAGELFDVGDAGGFDLFNGLGADAREGRERGGGRCERGHLLFDFAALFFFGLDVDVPANELAGQTNILALLANGQGELGVLNDDFELVSLGIHDLHASDLRGAESLLRERDRFFAVGNDVDFFAAQFADDGLHAHTLHAYAGADGIDILVTAGHCNFGAFTGFARGKADLHRAVVNFRNFHFEEALDQAGVRAGHDDLRAFGGAVDHFDDHAQAFANIVGFQFRLFTLGQARFGAAHVDDKVRPFGALDDNGDKLADAAVVFIEDGVALGFAHFLQNDLLGGLRGDAAEDVGGFVGENFRAHYGIGIFLSGVLEADFLGGVGDFFDDGHHRKHVDLAGFGIKFSPEVFFGLVIFARGDAHRVLDGRHHDRGLNVLLAAEHFDLLIEQIRHVFPKSPLLKTLVQVCSRCLLELYNQIRFANHEQGNLHDASFLAFQRHAHVAVGKTRETALKKLGVADRFAGGDFRQAPGKPGEMLRLGESPVHSRRADLQRVARRARDQILNVEDDAQLLANALAIRVTDLGVRRPGYGRLNAFLSAFRILNSRWLVRRFGGRLGYPVDVDP